eukprot:TRINITY_DN3363_c0_g2_i1.p1 TRINITY_DN3363_c0_g2~~TRINITY_DN3363_c0_g2_i1.p1  ORF type:complete len:410 (-),score=67.99 TRINITY_DN3363_c0_g2_i1:132-1361(-)
MSGIGSLIVKVKTKTWEKDSYGLFDYETKTNINKNEFTVRNTGKIIRKSNLVQYIPLFEELIEPGETHQNLALIDEDGGELQLKDAEETVDQKLWLVVKHKMKEDKHGYRLQEGDIIKLGRVIFKIKNVKIEGEGGSELIGQKSFLTTIKQHCPEDNAKKNRNLTTENNEPSNECDTSKNSSHVCRICLAEQYDDSDPLISPCKCKGSMMYIHIVCLQKWMRSKLNVKEENNSIITIIWKNLACELCKEKLPLTHNFNNKELDILLFNSKSDKYIVLESLAKDCNPNGIHIIDLTNKQSITIGRGHECDLRISDISVSRLHARLHLQKGKVYLEDKSSKFGTLVQVNQPLDLLKAKSVKVQTGRTTIKINIKKSWSLFFPCFGGGGLDINRRSLPPAPREKRDGGSTEN